MLKTLKGFVSAANLLTSGIVLFDEVKAPETKTYTQADIDKAFKAGSLKAKEKQATEAERKELETLKAEKAERLASEEMATLTNSVKEAKIENLRGHNRFAKEFKERLTGKTGNDLIAEIKKIGAEEGNDLYFTGTQNPKAGNSIAEAAAGGVIKQEQKVEYYKGSTIRKN